MKIFISGSSGMLGKELASIMPDAFCPSSEELDLTDQKKVEKYFKQNKFDFVVHLAAYTGNLHDSKLHQTLFFEKNVLMNTLIVKYAYESGVENFLGILSNTVYSDAIKRFPLKENQIHDGSPHKDLLSYAFAKRALAVLLDGYKDTFGLNYNYLIPCNLYGLVSKKNEKRSQFINDLIFKIIDAKREKRKSINLFGDGTPMRQFMLASDFAEIINIYIKSNINSSFNVAPDFNLSIKEITSVALEATDSKDFKVKFDSSMPNGQLRKDLSIKNFKKEIEDFSFTPLSEGIKKIYDYYR